MSRSRGLWLPALAGAGYASLAFAAILFTRAAQGVATIWLANAYLLGLLVRAPAGSRGWIMLAGALGCVAANLAADTPPSRSLGFAAINMVGVVLAWTMLSAAGVKHRTLPDERDFFLGMPAAVLLAPALAAAVGASWLGALDGAAWSPLFLDWWSGDALGMIALLPVMWSASSAQVRGLVRGPQALEFWIWVLVCGATAAIAPLVLAGPFVAISLPLLVAAYRMGVFRTSLLALVCVLTVVAAAVLEHRGQLAPGTVHELDDLGVAWLGLYSAMAVLGPILVAIVVERRELIALDSQRAHHRLTLVADNVPVLIGYLDAGLRYRYANRRFEDWFGTPRDQVIGHTPAEIPGAAGAAALDARLAGALAGQTQRFAVGIADRELEAIYVPHRENDTVEGVFVLAHDVTQRNAAERALFEEKDRLLTTLNSIGDAVVACDTDMRLTMLNPVAELMTGWTLDEALGKPVHDVVELIDLASGETPLSPLRIALKEDRVVALQVDSALVRRGGLSSPIEDTAAPIRSHDGTVVGAVMVFHDISESRAMALKMSHLAQHDYLTDLPNRVLLQDRLSQALTMVEHGMTGALLFVDLDLFKHINDSLGHEAGDRVLQEVSKRLLSSVRDDDTVSRQGGDEFVLLLQRLADPRDAARVAEKLIKLIERPIEVDEQSLHVSASVGIALFPQDSRDLRTLMKQADTALYHAKEAGRGRYSYFTRRMSERADQRLRMERELRAALDEEALTLVYQPKFAMPERRIVGMEALVRWRSASGKTYAPDLFVPLAEECGLITRLDEWVMRTACRQASAWRESGLQIVPMAVNVSLARLDPQRLIDHIVTVLHDTGLPPRMLEVEFTESQMFQRREASTALMEQLKLLGVRTAVDDFGTGYSSLGYLVQYRFDTLKIDRSFVRSMRGDGDNDAIVQAIIGLGRSLDYTVVAEGVETQAQADALLRYGCSEMQGYLLSRPVAEANAAALLHETGTRV